MSGPPPGVGRDGGDDGGDGGEVDCGADCWQHGRVTHEEGKSGSPPVFTFSLKYLQLSLFDTRVWFVRVVAKPDGNDDGDDIDDIDDDDDDDGDDDDYDDDDDDDDDDDVFGLSE